MSINLMNIRFIWASRLVVSIEWHRFGLQVTASWSEWNTMIFWVRKMRRSLIFVANAIAEVRGFIHILPQTVKIDHIREIIQVLLPPCDCCVMEEIRIDSIDRPHFACEVGSIFISFNKDILFNTCIVNTVALIFSLSNTSINDWNELKIVFMNFFYECWQVTKVSLINSEILVVLHVVDITPESI